MIVLQKRSHKLLANTLLHHHGSLGSKVRNLAFLFGSFQPDCNPLSYLKGSLHGRKFRGHDFTNSQRYLFCRIRRLQQCRRWSLRQYYTLGKLTHYLADAFTYAHSRHFPSSPQLHHQYETQLRYYLTRHIAEYPVHRIHDCPDICDSIQTLHYRYLNSPAGICTDAQYILHSAALLMTLPPPAHRESA